MGHPGSIWLGQVMLSYVRCELGFGIDFYFKFAIYANFGPNIFFSGSFRYFVGSDTIRFELSSSEACHMHQISTKTKPLRCLSYAASAFYLICKIRDCRPPLLQALRARESNLILGDFLPKNTYFVWIQIDFETTSLIFILNHEARGTWVRESIRAQLLIWSEEIQSYLFRLHVLARRHRFYDGFEFVVQTIKKASGASSQKLLL